MRKQLKTSLLVGLAVPIALLGIIVLVFDKPLFTPPCPDGLTLPGGGWAGPFCAGGFLTLGVIGVLSAAGVVSGSVTWIFTQHRQRSEDHRGSHGV